MTPMMEQYLSLKAVHPHEILFFRMGDFYEMFFDDATAAAEILGIALTSRSKAEEAPGGGPIPMAGVPHHSALTYIRRLLRAGKRVAICEQLDDPREVAPGTLIRREVVEVVTPGTVTDAALLEEGAPNHLLAVTVAAERRGRRSAQGAEEEAEALERAPEGPVRGAGRGGRGGGPDGAEPEAGLAWIDLASGRFFLAETPAGALGEVLARIDPAECLVPESLLPGGARAETRAAELVRAAFSGRRGAEGAGTGSGTGLTTTVTPYPDFAFERAEGKRLLLKRFGVATL